MKFTILNEDLNIAIGDFVEFRLTEGWACCMVVTDQYGDTIYGEDVDGNECQCKTWQVTQNHLQ